MVIVLLALTHKTAAAASSSTSSSSSSSSSRSGSSKLQEDAVVFTSAVASALKQFESGMDDDLNGPRAAAGLFALIKVGEKVVSNCFLQLLALTLTATITRYLLVYLYLTIVSINRVSSLYTTKASTTI
jgi:cysteinyl-tRNA synthetase